ncbi:glucose PTS transporter subunit EIIB [Vibrio panuliri]|uniref:PTS glucose transporter subunit IIB n=1 Tax=Vibrio panuliri TaxID=1381081 RepID=A0A1Q9HQR6_9VIBR|nr:PTS glucose/sucrose transporter subunit IIB [Vibrio panuliri]KAB1458105.1 PTS glucose transporter subunit IIB [Vibrio panuliri]OLQ89511.1 PTS glucose transporter subunit IIB [Vibrio panuliri]OLQ93224.1 PTS glucose transporter subunit IIB [Vibrio panuliri]
MFSLLRRFFAVLTRVNPDLDHEVDTIISALGGLDNILDCGACATRLRLELKELSLLDEKALKQAGAIGVVRIDQHHVQIIYGLKANSYAQCIEQRRS